ncbi:alpha/beta hydrolase, partial [Cellulomonas sp. NPDC057328]|uniref:alpha/beta hydrolase n=1 Tax=Cellulomonas sp. NPDC057328 TaxID=3346101 RepID=UPI00362B0D38
MQTIATGHGRRLALDTVGDAAGPPVVVLPGGPCRGPEYLGDLAGLAAVRRLAVVHPRGTASTGGLSRGWWRDAEDVPAVLRHLGGAPLDVLAHSAGTRLALALAARFPGQVRSLTLVTPPSTWLTGAPHDGADLVAARRDPVVDTAWAALCAAGDTADEATFQRALTDAAPAGYA